MRPKSMILIVIALGCGLIASIGISQVLEKRSGDGPQEVQTAPVYVAMVDIPIGDPLTPQSIKVEEWPIDKVPEGSISNMKDLEGLSPRQPIYAGEVMLERKLAPVDLIGGSAQKIPQGYRVVSVKVTMDSAVSGLMLPGDRVDVLVFLRASQATGMPTTKTFLTDVTVFAINSQITRETDEAGNRIDAKTVSLLVKPEQAERVMLAAEVGRLSLSLRRSDEEDATRTDGADLSSLDNIERVRSKKEKTDDSPAPTQAFEALLGMAPAVQQPAFEETMEVVTPDGVKTFHWDDDTNSLPVELREVDTADAALPAGFEEAMGAGNSATGGEPGGRRSGEPKGTAPPAGEQTSAT